MTIHTTLEPTATSSALIALSLKLALRAEALSVRMTSNISYEKGSLVINCAGNDLPSKSSASGKTMRLANSVLTLMENARSSIDEMRAPAM